MPILALEFSTRLRTVAASCIPQGPVFSASAEGLRSTNTIEMTSAVLASSGLKMGDIDTVLVGLGPGSYTGVRAALAFAQGWQLASGGAILAIPSNHAMALELVNLKKSGAWRIVIDAQKKEFYSAAYEISQADFQLRSPLEIMDRSAISGALAQGESIAGPDALLLKVGMDLFPQAESLIRILESKPELAQKDLEPVYLRPISYVKAVAKPPLPGGLSESTWL